MDSINIKELAQKLNLSKSTISRAFRDHNDISSKTKERILAFAKELNYQPNHHASNLRAQKSKNIAVIVPEITNNFFSQAIDGIEKVASEKGYHVLIYLTSDCFEKEVSYVNDLYNGRADGIIMSVSGDATDQTYLNKLREKKMPLVFFDRGYDTVPTAKVTTNDYEISFEATTHLIKSGCRNIIYLMVNENLSIFKNRFQGYIDALKKFNINYNDEMLVYCGHNFDENYTAINKAFVKLRPDGVFASVERLAFATYYICNDLKLSIPKQVKVISFSSLEIAPLLNPPLTTITQPAFEMGVQAATLLFKKLLKKTDNPDEQIMLNSKIIIRSSTTG